jgi:excisionase family DNA binding protein
MEELLTAKQVQDLLKVDRTTIYRMLNDGRLAGIKVGNQWRFSSAEVNNLISGVKSQADKSALTSAEALPLHCVQPVQTVFAEIAEIGAVTVDKNGKPLTKISNSCEFCNLMLDSESGAQACIDSWRRLALQSEQSPQFMECHAGLKYARARIEISGELAAMLVAGQFHENPPEQEKEAIRIKYLAQIHHIDPAALAKAAGKIRLLDERKQVQIGGWLQRVAHTFEEIGNERAELMGRLKRIAEMTAID